MDIGPLLLGGIGGLILGGAFNGGSNDQTSVQTQSSKLPPWLENAVKFNVQRSSELALEPFQKYNKPMVAGLEPEQEQAITMARNSAEEFMPLMNEARGIMSGVPTEFDSAAAKKYMNPYISEVMDRTLARYNEEAGTAMRNQDLAAAGAKAFGGARHGIQAALMADKFQQGRGDLIAGMNMQGYTNAQEQFERDRAAMMGKGAGIAGLVPILSGARGDSMNRLMTGGAVRQGVNQAGIDRDYGEFIRATNWPYNQANFMAGIASGAPVSKDVTGTVTQPGPNNWAQIAGLGIAGLGAVGSNPGLSQQIFGA